MSVNIKNREVVILIDEVARLTGESKTEAVRRSLEERRARLAYQYAGSDRASRLARFLQTEAWPVVPADQLGRVLTRPEEDRILGYGPEGA
jgi:antitoxin VapB